MEGIIGEIIGKFGKLGITGKYVKALNTYIQDDFDYPRCKQYADEIIEGIREVVKYAFNNGGDKKAFGDARKTIKNSCKAIMKLTTVNPKALSQSDAVYERVARQIDQYKEKVDKSATEALKQRLNNTIDGIAAAEKFGLISTNVQQKEFVSADGSVNPEKLKSIVEDGTWESIYDLSSKTAEDHFNKILRKINFIRDCIVYGKDVLSAKGGALNEEIKNICTEIINWSNFGEIVQVSRVIKNTEADDLDLLIEVISSEVLEDIEIIQRETNRLPEGEIKKLYGALMGKLNESYLKNFYYLHCLMGDGFGWKKHMKIIQSPVTIGDTELEELKRFVKKIGDIENVKGKINDMIKNIRANMNAEQV